MKALVESSERILINQIDINERDLIDFFINKTINHVVDIRELFDIDNNLDGVSLDIGILKKDIINYTDPGIQVLTAGASTIIDFGIDSETQISVNSSEFVDYLTITFIDNKMNVYAKNIVSLAGTTKQYVLTITLTKGENIVMFNLPISVMYFTLPSITTEDIDNLFPEDEEE